jgi:hypothetical protein
MAGPSRLTYYVDASIPIAVRKAIALVRDDILYAGGPAAPSEETPDDVWLAAAGAGDWVCIHRDKRIRYRPRERQAYLDAGVRLFCLTTAGNATRWQTLSLLVSRWSRIEETARSDAGPYIYAVTSNRFDRIAPALR